jgi:hypothetical protein
MNLVEGRLAGEENGCDARKLASSLPGVEIDESTAGRSEFLAVAAQFAPELSRHEKTVGLGNRVEPRRPRRFVEHRDVEEPVPISFPVDRFEKRVLLRSVVTVEHRLTLHARSEVSPAGADD